MKKYLRIYSKRKIKVILDDGCDGEEPGGGGEGCLKQKI
jgi:hypothetical protein